jgi:type II pantothenate kinase
LGGLFLSGVPHAVVVSMGTGTAFVDATNEVSPTLSALGSVRYSPGLANCNFEIRISGFLPTLHRKDLSSMSISASATSQNRDPGLSKETTASNFGKLTDMRLKKISLLYFQSGFSVHRYDGGACSQDGLSQRCGLYGSDDTRKTVQGTVSGLFQYESCSFHVPELAEFATAIGAALYTE